jgi:hypothetical protein
MASNGSIIPSTSPPLEPGALQCQPHHSVFMLSFTLGKPYFINTCKMWNNY